MAKGKRRADVRDTSYKAEEYNGYTSDYENDDLIDEEKTLNYQEYEEYDYDDEDSKKKYIIIAIVILIAIACIIGAILLGKKENTETVENTVQVEQAKKLESTYSGYKVLGKIVIEKINVDQYILDSKEDAALKVGVTKLYGSSLNNYGNFCIAGHNYDNIFGKLNELSVGEEIKILDSNLNETIYEIKEIFEVEPDDLSSLHQNDEKVEITLITCESGSTKRLIVKAEEKTKDNG